MDTIIQAIPSDDFRIDIVTSGGVRGIFDVKPYLGGGAFKDLCDENYFRLVRPAHHGIRWPNEQDFSADTIIWDMQNKHADSTLTANDTTLAALDQARSGALDSFSSINALMMDMGEVKSDAMP